MGHITIILVACVTVLPVIMSSYNQTNKQACQRGAPGLPGNNGVPGHNGIPGTPGRDGRDAGLRGKPGPQGAKGDRGKTGPPGSQGIQGKPGDFGIKGDKGNRGETGPPGSQGIQGKPGDFGIKGDKGESGPPGVVVQNWKQCAWDEWNDKDTGLIKECSFKKKHSHTALRVAYGGNLRIISCTQCCKRWYFTFNGAECSGPLPIDGVFFMSISNDIHRHRHIEGYCTNIPAGIVRVGFWVGNCKSFGNANAHSGWNSISRIMIEEVIPQQS